MRSAVLFLLTTLQAILPAGTARAQAGQWTNVGPETDLAGPLAFDPQHPSTFYAGTAAGLFRSDDAGETWRNAGLIGWQIVSIAVDPQHPDTLYAATSGNAGAEPEANHAFKTTDGGITWNPADAGLPPQWSCCVELLPISRQDAPALYAFAGSPRFLFRSTDGGANWSVTTPPPFQLFSSSVAIDPRNSSVVYVAGQGVVAGRNAAALFKSVDGGTTWSEADSGLPGAQNLRTPTPFVPGALAIDPRAPDNIYVTLAGVGVYKSTNGAASWKPANSGLPNLIGDYGFMSCCSSGAVLDPREPNTLYAPGMNPGNELIYKSSNGGANWRAVGSLGAGVRTLAMDLLSTLYAASYTGPRLESTDGGATWRTAVFRLRAGAAPSLAFDPQTPGTLYAGNYKSSDAGATWSSLSVSSAGPVTAFAVDPQSGSVYAGISEFHIEDGYPVPCGPSSAAGVFKTLDGGANWADTQAGIGCVSSLALDPQNPATLYAGTLFKGAYKTVDGGDHWQAINTGLPAGRSGVRVNALAMDVGDPANPGALYAGTDAGTFTSTDGGENWSPAGLSPETRSLAVDSQNPGTLYAATSAGLFRTTDAGATWQNVWTSSVNAVTVDAQAPATVYLATDDGISRSDDDGETWAPIPASPGFVHLLALDPQAPGTIYAAGPAGLFRFITVLN